MVPEAPFPNPPWACIMRMALLCEMRPTRSPHSDGDAGTAITVPLMLTGPTPHDDITILQLLCCLCRQPRATPPADSRVN